MPIEIESPEQMGYGNIECNLTESSYADATLAELDLDLNRLVLCYGDHFGKPDLRALIASEAPPLGADEILITAGAASALFIVATSLLKSGDQLVVMRPNYATNIETPRAIGADVEFLDLLFEDGFRIDLDRLETLITPRTKIVSVTTPHNPTGAMMSEDELERLIRLVEQNGTKLLVDETYREMAFGKVLPCAAALSESVISVSSLSKTYGLPGIRTGWIACRNRDLMYTFLAAKEQMIICNSVVDEEIAFRFLERKREKLPMIQSQIRKHFGILREWMRSQVLLEWVEPKGGVVCFPRMKQGIDVNRFYETLNRQYKTYVGPGHWFEQDRRFMRIGYGWPATDELRRGLQNVTNSLKEASMQ